MIMKWSVTLMLETEKSASICYMLSNIVAKNEKEAINNAITEATKLKYTMSVKAFEVANVELQKESMH
jgi:hypothetical protein